MPGSLRQTSIECTEVLYRVETFEDSCQKARVGKQAMEAQLRQLAKIEALHELVEELFNFVRVDGRRDIFETREGPAFCQLKSGQHEVGELKCGRKETWRGPRLLGECKIGRHRRCRWINSPVVGGPPTYSEQTDGAHKHRKTRHKRYRLTMPERALP